MFNKDVASNFIVGLCFIAAGLVMFFIPNRVFSLILNTSIILLLINGVYLLIRFLQHKKKSDLLFLILSILFALFLVDHETIPQWIIRVAFGLYCYISTLASLIQLVINYINDIPDKFYHFLMIVAYGILGFNLLFVDEFETDLLLRLFGIYFILLGSRYFNDANVGVNPLLKYEWKRKIRITVPTIVCAFIPDWTLTSINRYLSSGKPFALEKKDYEDDQILKVMVHVGPNGIQKVGHITFSYKGIVYSYGNYDEESFRLNQTIGDGVFFTVPFEYYIPNMMSAENNSIFEYHTHSFVSAHLHIKREALCIKPEQFLCIFYPKIYSIHVLLPSFILFISFISFISFMSFISLLACVQTNNSTQRLANISILIRLDHISLFKVLHLTLLLHTTQ